MREKEANFKKLCLEIEKYIKEESFKYDEIENLQNYSKFLIDLNDQYKNINFKELGHENLSKINKTFNKTYTLIWKKMGFLIPNEQCSYHISKFCEYFPYIRRYEINLKKISKLLKSVQINIDNFDSESIKFLDNSNLFENTYNVEVINYILSAAIQLRYCIEIIINQSILNNMNKLKNNYKSHLEDNFSETLSYLNKNQVDYVVKTLFSKEELVKNEFKYYKSEFWLNIASWYQYLNSIVHYQVKYDLNLSINNTIIENEKKYSNYVEKELIFPNIQKVKDIYKYLYNTIENHIISFENDECYVIIKDFKIDYNNLNKTFIFKNQNTIVNFIEIKNE